MEPTSGIRAISSISTKSSLMQQAYAAIKEAICNNVVKPGDVLSENQIAKELGMSRTPVREALRMLASEDYIEVRNGTGILVKTLSQEDIRNLLKVRKSLEVLAADTAIHNILVSEIDLLEKGFLQMLEDYHQHKQIDPGTFITRDYQLHELLIERCNNKYVRNIMESINANIKRFQGMSFAALNNLPESTEQHLRILALIRTKNGAGLTKALTEHIEWAEACVF